MALLGKQVLVAVLPVCHYPSGLNLSQGSYIFLNNHEEPGCCVTRPSSMVSTEGNPSETWLCSVGDKPVHAVSGAIKRL